MTTRNEAAANSISESSGMRYDGFWSRVEDLEPEDREYALAEASAALAAADAWEHVQGIRRIRLDEETVERAARAARSYAEDWCADFAEVIALGPRFDEHMEGIARSVLIAATGGNQTTAHRIVDDATFERMARVLIEEGAYGVPWGDASEDDRADALNLARRVLAAAVKEDG